MNETVVECQSVTKVFKNLSGPVAILDNADLVVQQGESIAIVGASGSGKTTLLHLIGGLDTPNSGNIMVAGQSWGNIPHSKAAQWRNQNLGFVFQFHLLLPELTLLENVALPLLLRRVSRKDALSQAKHLLESMHLQAHINKTPDKISGGERQRVAIGRALIGKPKCILADEPTGNLDRKNAFEVFAKMKEQIKTNNTALVLVTHDEQIAALTDKKYTLQQGRLTR